MTNKYENYSTQQLANAAKELYKDTNDMAYRLQSKDINDMFDAVVITQKIRNVQPLPRPFDIDETLNGLMSPWHVKTYKDIRLMDYDIHMFDGIPTLYTRVDNNAHDRRTILKEEDETEIDYKLVQCVLQYKEL